MSAKLLHAHVEGHPRAQRGLLEDHRQRLALQGVFKQLRPDFHLAGDVQKMPNLLRREVANRKKVHRYLPASTAAGLCSSVKRSSNSVIAGWPISSTS